MKKRLLLNILISLALTLSCRQSSSNEIPNGITQNNNAASITEENNNFQNGDIIFQTSKSSQSIAIQKATNSRYSHMGVIYQEGHKFYVFEAVQPVKMTPLQEWIDRGVDKHYVVKRLKGHKTILTKNNLLVLKMAGKKYEGKDYDLFFEWSDEKIYCSELVWKMYKESLGIEIGKLQKLKDFDLSDAIVQSKIRERYGDNIPQEEIVISPEAMFVSNKLMTVIER